MAKPEVPPMLVKDANDNLVPLVDLQGKFTAHVGEFAGKYVKNEYYNAGEAPERSEKYVHSYPNCWRTDKPILYYPLDSWFIKITDVKDRMHELNLGINWKPKSTGEGRFGNWLASANDWNLSRSKTEEICIGSVAELKAEMKKALDAGILAEDIFADFESGNMSEENYAKIDLHKNIVDQITLVSPSGKPMQRESDLIDVWFDSGSMPVAQWHYPFENKEKVEAGERKADFIAEGVDQTRGWFYTLHAIATMIFDDVAYKNVMSNGLVLDKNGQKMSKRLGNATDPFTTLEKYGPDATRWYMISNANPWDNLKFDLEGIAEVRRKFFGTLYNTYSFFGLYANIDGFNYSEADIPLKERPEIDQWILSELNTLIQKVDAFYYDYEPTRATRAISDFVQENLSNWYVRLCRRRFWKGEYAQDKISAYQTLYTCLVTVSKLGAPVAPFFMDRLYMDLVACTGKEVFESVHLADFPTFDSSMVNKTLEEKMNKAQTVSSLVLSLRQKEKIKVRQPLQRIMIPVLNSEEKNAIEAVSDLIKSEVNVKEIELLDDASGILVKKIKPNFKALGPRFGKDMKLIANEIQGFDQDAINSLEQNGEYILEINGKNITLQMSDVAISSQDIEGWLVANANGLTTIAEAVADNGDYIKAETLAKEIIFEADIQNGVIIEFDTIVTKVQIQKV